VSAGADIVLRHVDVSAPSGTNGVDGAPGTGTVPPPPFGGTGCGSAQDGATGPAGLDGIWRFDGVQYVVGDGARPTQNGFQGQGGANGQSNTPQCVHVPCPCSAPSETRFGDTNGGSCGRGGYGGAAGFAGTGGTGSVGIILSNAHGSLIDSKVVVSSGGRGGSGGLGAAGANGEAGTNGRTTTVTCAVSRYCDPFQFTCRMENVTNFSGTGAAGTAGGRGGPGGRGGHGSGGPSIAIARIGASTTDIDATSQLTVGPGGTNGGDNRGTALAATLYDQP